MIMPRRDGTLPQTNLEVTMKMVKSLLLGSAAGRQGSSSPGRPSSQFGGLPLGTPQPSFDFYTGVFGYGRGCRGRGGSTPGEAGTLPAPSTAQFGWGGPARTSAEARPHRRNAVW